MLTHNPPSSTSAPNRVVINVATGHYIQYQRRWLNSLDAAGYTGARLYWTDSVPPESPFHHQAPYVFKLYALKHAISLGYTTLLWNDSGVEYTGHPDPLFEYIEKEGHYFFIGGDRLGNWSSDYSLEIFGETRDGVFEKEWQLIGGTVYGFDMTNTTTQEFYRQWWWHCLNGTFGSGYYNIGHLPEDKREAWKNKPVQFVSADPRCNGHRIDETVGSLIAYKLGMKLTPLGKLFQGYQRGRDDAIAHSGY